MRKSMSFSLLYFFEALQERETFVTKRMFGGLGLYYHGKMVAVLMESKEESKESDPWKGVLIPTDYSHQESMLKEWPTLQVHSVLKKWLYLPMANHDFEEVIPEIVSAIIKRDPRFGVEPSIKKRSKKKKKSRKVDSKKRR